MPIDFDPANKRILITSPSTIVTSLEIYSAAMDWADEAENMQYLVPMAAYGKFGMGTGIYSDSIFVLVNGWKIKPWSGNYQLNLSGTLITDDGSARTVLPDYGNVQIIFQVSSQGTITQLDVINRIDKFQKNRWKIFETGEYANQLVIYDDDGITILHRFNLKDKDGNPSNQNVFEREPV